jgi:hypothetical protein
MDEEKLEAEQSQPEPSEPEETPQPGSPPKSTPAQPAEPEEPAAPDQAVQEDPPAAVPPAPAPEGRFRRGFRLFIRWTAGVLLVFALGFLAATIALYLPKSREVVRTQDRLNEANTTIQEFEDQLAAVNLQLEAAENNQEIQQEALDSANLHTMILSALADVTQGRLALVNEDIEGTRLALTNTPETFQNIAALVDADQADAVNAMDQRLELALSVLEEDTSAALSDLEVIANNLVKLENTYFVVP